VSNARLILVVLLCASPAILLFDGPIALGMMSGVAAAGLVFIAGAMRPGETEFFLSFARRAALLLAIPALWMAIQLLPIPPIAHPVWASAATALGRPLAGSITIDFGVTVIALGKYLAITAVGFWSAAVAVDRQRAEGIFFALVAASALIGLTVVANGLFGSAILNLPIARSGLLPQAIDCVAMGVIIAIAAGIRTLERYETRHTSPTRSVSGLTRAFVACAFTFAICGVVLLLKASGGALVATGYGVVALAAIVCIRRLGLGPWGIIGIGLPIVASVVFLVASEPGLRSQGFPFAFAAASPSALIGMSQRILHDAPLTGTGAGSFAAIAEIYRNIDEQAMLAAPPTTAAAVAIELGRPMLWFVVAVTACSIVILLRSSLQRGRDSFYPAAGAACLITLLFLGFMDAGILGTSAATIAAAMLGLAFAQSKSRSVRE
jgi:hypothetical protein